MEQTDPLIAILGIGTAVPAYRINQADTAQRLAEALGDSSNSARWAKRIFKQCGVETRYTCEPNLLEAAGQCRYFPHTTHEAAPSSAPSTAERMRTYKREVVPLGLAAASKALKDCEAVASEITHLVTVSCTGQFLPGLDAVLTEQLGLAATVNRIPLNFLGCAAGLKAIILSRQIVAARPSAKVLIVCVELCTLHIQPSSKREALFATSFFGDGASACVVGAAEPHHKHMFQLGNDHSVLLPCSSSEMVWEVGDYGFDLYLSPNIPKLLGSFIPAEVGRLLSGAAKPELWAIHPGGKGIIDTLQEVFGLEDAQTQPSRTVLRDYGNVSSATLLFVLDEMRSGLTGSARVSPPVSLDSSAPLSERADQAQPVEGIALAFGPGLTAEMIQLTYLPSIKALVGKALEQHSGAALV
ncbi:type III polyketide synthase [Paenibacillus agricola]|uniref:Type III polyketide synthase n=1 Tax=Paenibacillus agricola TaxID=2716264 RepID=A0ABX0JCZ9_9BACL|nr:type III polyketide synthase [Paenibacillus agricola]NHN31796.1 type III polyketide synthase [Paenibacillus agricola]